MKNNSLSDLAFVNRMFAYFRRDGVSIEEAFNLVEEKMPADYKQQIDDLRQIIQHDYDDKVVLPSDHGAMIKSLGKHASGNHEKVAEETYESIKLITPGITACSRFLSSLYVYPMLISIISLSIFGVYKLFVFPSFSQLYGAKNIPGLTKWMFSDTMSILIVLFVVAVTFWGIWSTSVLITSLRRFKPRPSLMGSLTGVTQHHAYLIFLAYLKTLLACKSESSEAIGYAVDYANLDLIKTPHYSQHKLALEILNEGDSTAVIEEVEFQINDVQRTTEHALITRQEILLFGFQIVIFAFIGSLIVSMYLPIFKMASIF